MPIYQHPGVYVEEIPGGARTIEGVATSVAAFVGYAAKGPMKEPTLIFKWDEYEDRYGGIRDTGKQPQGDLMGFSVLSFFQNGGTKAYIVRLATGAKRAEGYLLHPGADSSNPKAGDRLVMFTATNEGTWGNRLQVQLSAKDGAPAPGLYTLSISRLDKASGDIRELERFTDLSMDSRSPDYIESKVNDASGRVSVDVQEIEEQLLGTSTSQDLSGFNVTELNGKKMTVTLESKGREIEFPQNQFTAEHELKSVAQFVQEKVRGGVTTDSDPRKNFTCTDVEESVEGLVEKRLVLTAGTRLFDSAVVVTGPKDSKIDAAKLLRLGVANDGSEQTGAEALFALLSRKKDEILALDGGADGVEPGPKDYSEIFSAFLKYRDINIICLPGEYWPEEGGDNPVISEAIAHAETMQNRMVIVDAPPNKELKTEAGVNALGLTTSSYAVLYHPWVQVTNPFYNSEKSPGKPRTLLVPPSGFAAGTWAKTDGRRGVWKAPAGVDTALLGVAGLQYTVEDGEQDQLNPLGINCLRKLPGYGAVIWGARTLSTKANPEWRYVSVRRTAIMIEQSIYDGIQWAVFKPNDDRLWSSLRVNIESFMNSLFQAGAFQGSKASDAYFVRCGLGETMTQGDIDRGQVIVMVGFAPLKPAEFVIVRIQQKAGQQ